ncbi:hypothetical protein [Casimicrobium huifangae]|uniref:hypothetical protein n=1 Tax=Casimicrobium huifangae TaxID=2591109 RepID=UPI003783CE82
MTAPATPTPANAGETNFVFPTVYPLKVAGKNDVALESTVVEIVRCDRAMALSAAPCRTFILSAACLRALTRSRRIRLAHLR